ncbi:MAG: sensor histidine kinase [Candidatus Xenobia bacterium]
MHANRPGDYVFALLGVAVATALFALFPYTLRDQIDEIYILIVVAIGTRFGILPALLTAGLAFVAWDSVVLPYYHQASSWDQLLSLMIFLAVSVLTGRVAAGARARALEAQEREQETAALYELSQAVATGGETDRVLERLLNAVVRVTSARACGIWQGHDLRAAAGDAPRPDASPPEALVLPVSSDGESFGVLVVKGMARQRVLEAAVHHAAVTLQREKLERAAAQAQATLVAEGLRHSFLSSVSHELRTPLALIKAAASSLASADVVLDPASQHELMQTVVHNSDRLNSLVGNLLDISRLESGAWKPTLEPSDVTEIVGGTLERLSKEDADRVQLDLPGDLPLVLADEVQVEQVLWNLVENALKYAHPGTPLKLSAMVASDGVCIVLEDEGPGIPTGAEKRVFEKFFRAHGERVPGMGVGLAVCQSIVEAHGGHIEAESTGRGARFSFTLRCPP